MLLPAVELNDDLAVAVVVDLLKLANVAWKMNISKCRGGLNVPLQSSFIRRRVRSFASNSISRTLKGRWSWRQYETIA
jgi:hypothetical protein